MIIEKILAVSILFWFSYYRFPLLKQYDPDINNLRNIIENILNEDLDKKYMERTLFLIGTSLFEGIYLEDIKSALNYKHKYDFQRYILPPLLLESLSKHAIFCRSVSSFNNLIDENKKRFDNIIIENAIQNGEYWNLFIKDIICDDWTVSLKFSNLQIIITFEYKKQNINVWRNELYFNLY